MTDRQKAAAFSVFTILGFAWWISESFPPIYWKINWHFFTEARFFSPYRKEWPFTNMQSVGIFAAALFLSLAGFYYSIIRYIWNRELGRHLHPATRELKQGIPGFEKLQRELQKQR